MTAPRKALRARKVAAPRNTSAAQKAAQLRARVRGRAEGAGGGKSGGGGGIEAPNTLQSKAIITIIDLLSEGPIGGLVNGAQSIYFNNTPLMNHGGSYNFKGVTYQLFTGTPDQGYASGFPAAQNTVQVGTQILRDTPVEFTISNTDCTRATVTIDIPALFDTDTHNGNTNPFGVIIQIDCEPASGTRTTILTDNIQGKCTSTYERSYTFDLPGEGPWSLFIMRNTPDSTNENIQDSTYLGSVDEIVDYKMLYPDSAYIALTFDSQYFGSSIPTRTYDLQGLLVQVPLNYNPTTRTYATTGPGTSGGTWDGVSMQPAATDNPAWIVLDLITNNRYGMGLSPAALNFTKWDLYQIAQYCDGMVPDGFGGMEPRYTCNMVMSSRDDAYNVLTSVTSIWRGMSYWGAGSLRFTADMPTGVSKIVTQADVIDGNFTYEGTSLKTRHTMAIVNYLDPTNYWQPTPCVYQDPELTVNSTIGPNLIQVNALGATTLGQAYRQGHWLLDSEQHQTETVTYKAGLDHMTVRPGDVIALHDPAYAGLRYGGRLRSVVAGTGQYAGLMNLTLDGAFAEVTGDTYALDFELPNGSIMQSAGILGITQNADGTATVVVATSTPLPEAGGQWLMISSALAPRQFRIIGVTIPQRGQVEVTALLHDPNKYERVELGIDLADDPFSVLPLPPSAPLTPPTNITLLDYFVGEGSTTILRTTVGWTAADDYRVVSYDISASSAGGYINTWTGLQPPTYDIDNLPIDTYVFGVRSRDSTGATSTWLYSQPTLINGQPIAPPQVLGVTAIGGTRMITLSWLSVSVQNLLYYEVWRAPVTQGAVGSFALLAQVSATVFSDTNGTLLGPLTTWAYEVRAVTTLLVYGPFSATVEAETTNLLVSDLPAAIAATAAYAQSLLGSAPTVVTGLPPTGGTNQFVVNTQDGALYQWRDAAGATSPSWQLCPVVIDESTGSIIAGVIKAGAIASGEIAGLQVNATNLSVTDTLLTTQAQIGYAVIGTLQLVNDSVTSFSTTSRSDSITGNSGGGATGGFQNVISFTVSVPQSRQAIIFLTGTQSYSEAEGPGNTSFNFNFILNGTNIFSDGHSSETTAPNYQVPCTLQQGTNTVEVDWAGNAGVKLGSRSLTVFGRIV